MRSVVGFLAISGLFALGLRILHVAVPVLYPRVLSGPFSLERVEDAEEYTGFPPLVPFYRPEVLGQQPIAVTAARRPVPRVTVFWSGDHFLWIDQQRIGHEPPHPPGERPLPGHPEATWWREGRTEHVLFAVDDLWVKLRTDLPEQDVHRLVETMRPATDLR